ncbi:jg4378 [Pararge aegeria aegeria]|uniref:Eukaryotic peptide chain release factor subunit 1 n=1 Tax=Pararge aegeria aegeria TaxID=348720 RepID=A0A8S4R582_9NEOP|nr:jg4378 [Pararge aegeria aegeria]
MSEESSADRNVEIWKIKKLIKSLEMARGNGTSMISLIIPPKDQISRVSKMLADEFGTASNIKSRVNRLSVLGAITSVQHRLKLYTKGEIFYIYKYKNHHMQQLFIVIIDIQSMVHLIVCGKPMPKREQNTAGHATCHSVSVCNSVPVITSACSWHLIEF